MKDKPQVRHIDVLSLDPETEAKIKARIVELFNPKRKPRFCVDGRAGQRVDRQNKPLPREPYGQALGGDLNITTVRWLLEGGQEDYLDTVSRTNYDLSEAGYEQFGSHDGGHAHGDNSDCGFADNNAKIITILAQRLEEIWALISQAVSKYPNIQLNGIRFKQLVLEKVDTANLAMLPPGKKIIDHAASLPNAAIQHLEKDHKEQAALVNLQPNTTLDTDNNQDEAQAFNLDLWLVQQQAQDLGINVEDATLLTLGLYVATEMVLVEAKRNVRLKILINQ